jgi:hypothetical protein
VGGIVVQDQTDAKIGRNGTIDLIQEFAELDGAMAWPGLPITDPVAMSKAANRVVVVRWRL